MQTKENPRSPYIQSLDRGLAILQLVGRSKQPVSLTELADLLGIDRSSASRFAITLRRRDYPKADRQFLIAMHRLTRIDDRPYEQVVTLDNEDIFNYPWIYAVQVQNWSFTPAQAKRLREYLLKGGFLMVDDFHGTEDWENFMNGMREVLPDRPIEDLQSSDEIFHTLYDVDDKMQIPGEQYVWTAGPTRKDGYQPKWRAIRDDKGRIIVAICHNMHLGDAWEWADDPNYPETFASMAFRVGLDYIIYGMTH